MSNSINRIVSTEEQIFDSVKDAFINKINHVAEKTGQYYPSLTILTNLCCSEEEKQILLDLAIKIKENEDSIFGTSVSFKDICYGVIYTYYGLNLSEDLSYFNISVLPRDSNKEILFENIERWTVNKEFNYWINTHTDNISMVYYLYIRLGMPSLSQPQFGDIITKDGENLSEKLRKFVIPPSQTTTSSASPIKPAKTSTRPISKRGGKKSKRTTKKTRRRRRRRRNHTKIK